MIKNAQILWHSHRNEVDNILTVDETKAQLKRAIDAWHERDDISEKVGPGRYAIVGYDQIKRITIPLKNDHMLFVSVQGDKPEYIKDLINIVDYVGKISFELKSFTTSLKLVFYFSYSFFV